MLRNSSAFLVLDYEEVVLSYGSIDMRTKTVLSMVQQLNAFKDNWSKFCSSEFV